MRTPPPGQAAGRTGTRAGRTRCLWSDCGGSRRAGGNFPPTSAPSHLSSGVAAFLPPGMAASAPLDLPTCSAARPRGGRPTVRRRARRPAPGAAARRRHGARHGDGRRADAAVAPGEAAVGGLAGLRTRLVDLLARPRADPALDGGRRRCSRGSPTRTGPGGSAATTGASTPSADRRWSRSASMCDALLDGTWG